MSIELSPRVPPVPSPGDPWGPATPAGGEELLRLDRGLPPELEGEGGRMRSSKQAQWHRATGGRRWKCLLQRQRFTVSEQRAGGDAG